MVLTPHIKKDTFFLDKKMNFAKIVFIRGRSLFFIGAPPMVETPSTWYCYWFGNLPRTLIDTGVLYHKTPCF